MIDWFRIGIRLTLTTVKSEYKGTSGHKLCHKSPCHHWKKTSQRKFVELPVPVVAMSLTVRNPVMKTKATKQQAVGSEGDLEGGGGQGQDEDGAGALKDDKLSEPPAITALYWLIFIFPTSTKSFPSPLWGLTLTCWLLFFVPLCFFVASLSAMSAANCVLCEQSSMGNSTGNATLEEMAASTGSNTPTSSFKQLERFSAVVWYQVQVRSAR